MLVLEWLAAIGVSNAIGFAYEQVLKDLFMEGMRDYAKDFLKDKIKDAERLVQLKPVQIAVGKALKEFMLIIQQELQELGENNLDSYVKPLKIFLKDKQVKSTLVGSFSEGKVNLDSSALEARWCELELRPLPEEFDWEIITRKFSRIAKGIFLNSEELRKNWIAELTQQIQTDTRQISISTAQIASTLEVVEQELIAKYRLAPNFSLKRYCESIEERYSFLKLNILDSTYHEYKLKLWSVFVFQNVIEGLPPSRHEFSKDIQRELIEKGESESNVPTEKIREYKREYLQKPLRSAEEVVEDAEMLHTVFVGDPGSGKST